MIELDTNLESNGKGHKNLGS